MICKLDSSYMQSLHILFSIAERSSFMAYHFVWILIRYYSIQKLKGKSDVYSFGAVLLELISGRKPVIRYWSDLGIVHWLKKRKNQMENHKVKEALKHPICQACYDKEISREMHQNSMLKKEHKRLYEMLFPNTMGWGRFELFLQKKQLPRK